VIEPADAFVTIPIENPNLTNAFKVVTNLNAPDGLDYSPTLNSLIASEQYNSCYLVQIGTNQTAQLVMTQFSGVSGIEDELELAVAKVTTNGFTNGWMFFGNNNGIGHDGAVGRISPDGSSYSYNWAILTNAGANHTLLYFDQTGIFSNDLIAVAGIASPTATNTVWLIDSMGHTRLLASIPSLGHEWEGVITLSNDPNKYGYFAGDIVIGVEGNEELYAINTNGNATLYETTNWIANGIQPEHLDIIPANVASQNLYWVEQSGGTLLKLSGTCFTNNAGDLLITQGGEIPGTPNQPCLYVAHWNTNSMQFDLKFIPVPSAYTNDNFEDVIFAPINLPAH